MKKRILAVLLTGVVALSFAACSNNGDKDSSKGEAAAPAESQESVVELDERIREPIESAIGADVLGNKTKAFINQFLSDELDVTISMKIPEAGESGEMSASIIPAGTEISVGFAKNAENAARVNIGIAGSNMDMLTNSDGIYFLNSNDKTAILTKVEQQSSNAESSTDMSEVISSYGLTKDTIKSAGEGEEKFGDNTYSYEAYTINYDPSALSGIAGLTGSIQLSSADESSKTQEPITLKLYFDGDSIKGCSIGNGENKVDINISKFETKADASLFTVPSDYTVTEDESGMGILGLLGGFSGSTPSIPEMTPGE